MQKRKIYAVFFSAAALLILTAVVIFMNGKDAKRVSAEIPSALQEKTAAAIESPETAKPAETQAQQTNIAEPVKPAGKADALFSFPEAGVRPIAVMIDNEGVKSLPQGGLDKAQVIYEIIVEGGETRLMPLFWGASPEMIGPVRSSRHYFLDYAMENDAIYVHFGWSPMAMRDIPAFKINNINGVANGGDIFWDLTKDRYNWQDSYTSMERILGYVKKAGYRTSSDKKPVFTYSRDAAALTGGSRAENISIKYSASYSCGYAYDAGTMLYLRLRKNMPQIERSSGKQLAASNIIIQYVRNNTIKGDTEGRQELADTGSGSGWYITQGSAVKLKWSKESRTAATRYVDEAGRPINLNPGQTWVQIVPVEAKVEIK